MYVKPKKSLGQHFLIDKNIAENIVNSLTGHQAYDSVLEIGPGTGVLTDFLLKDDRWKLKMIELDRDSIKFLKETYPNQQESIIEGDFLKFDLDKIFTSRFAIIGNFPYNISSQILFKVLENKDRVPELVCMLQKEVAERIASPPGKKAYGILSVLLQAYFDIEYLFTVEPHVFKPPPKVRSAVIRLQRNEKVKLDCDEVLLKRIVKEAFQKRRKTLRNALKGINLPVEATTGEVFSKRAEQLSVDDFVALTNMIAPLWNK